MTDFKFTSGKEPYLTKTSLAYMYSRLNNVSELFTTQNLFGGVVYHYPTLYEYTYTHIQYLDSRFKWFLFQPAMLIQLTGVGRPVPPKMIFSDQNVIFHDLKMGQSSPRLARSPDSKSRPLHLKTWREAAAVWKRGYIGMCVSTSTSLLENRAFMGCEITLSSST